MSRNIWAIAIKTGGSWVDQTNGISVPNDTFTISKMTTQTKTQLADGNEAFMTPSRKYNDQPLTFQWYEDDGTVKSQIEGYIESRNDLKITDDLGSVFVGNFSSISSSRRTGEDSEKYDIQAVFDRKSSLL